MPGAGARLAEVASACEASPAFLAGRAEDRGSHSMQTTATRRDTRAIGRDRRPWPGSSRPRRPTARRRWSMPGQGISARRSARATLRVDARGSHRDADHGHPAAWILTCWISCRTPDTIDSFERDGHPSGTARGKNSRYRARTRISREGRPDLPPDPLTLPDAAASAPPVEAVHPGGVAMERPHRTRGDHHRPGVHRGRNQATPDSGGDLAGVPMGHGRLGFCTSIQ